MAKSKAGRLSAACLGLVLAACAGGTTTKAASAPESAPQPGRSAEAPVMTCGPGESYAYVASRFKCPDGTNPLGGDVEKGRKARRGSLPSPKSSHMLDVYEVPCAGGKQALYVDMYGCPERERQLAEAVRGTPAAGELRAAYRGGDYANVVVRCEKQDVDAGADAFALCLVLVPAALYVEHRKSDSLSALTHACTGMLAATEASNVRAQYLAMVIGAFAGLVKDGKLELRDEQLDALVQSWLSACEVPAAQLQQTLEALRAE
ncbi:MAG: hypothetical protein QM756_35825 [Polyangiaceae bacterium]